MAARSPEVQAALDRVDAGEGVHTAAAATGADVRAVQKAIYMRGYFVRGQRQATELNDDMRARARGLVVKAGGELWKVNVDHALKLLSDGLSEKRVVALLKKGSSCA